MITRGYKSILKGCVFMCGREVAFIMSSMLLLSGVLNLVDNDIPRAFVNLPNAITCFIISLVAHYIHKKEELPRLTRIDALPISSSNPVSSGVAPLIIGINHPFQKCMSTSSR